MAPNPWAAWPAGAGTVDVVDLAARLRRAHEGFLADGDPPSPVRPVVLESWRRSRRSGVDPLAPSVDVAWADADLRAYRAEHPMAAVLPVVRRLLVEAAEDDGLVVALGDAEGRLLWVEGDRHVRDAVAAAGFVEGAVWSEACVGTSAPGLALATEHAVQVFAAEHFACPVQPWSCSAAPVHGRDGALLGVLDITGGDGAASPHMLSLVRAAVAAAEAELALAHVRRGTRGRAAARRPGAVGSAHGPDGARVDDGAAPRLDVLGRGTGRLGVTGAGAAGVGAAGGQDLSLRHSEILLLLAEHPHGLGADGLAVRLHRGSLSDVTVRAEVSRLRRVVGGLVGGSRPYRLGRHLPTDVREVRRHLDVGDVAAAVRSYRGPVLPRSEAPGVVALRDLLDAEVRAAVDATDDVGAVLAWAVGVGAEDWSAWRRLTDLLPAGTPDAARAQARLRLLDAELG